MRAGFDALHEHGVTSSCSMALVNWALSLCPAHLATPAPASQVMLNAREVAFPSRPAVSAEAKDFIRRCLLASVFWLESMLF